MNRGYNCVNNTLIDLTNPMDFSKVMPSPKRPLTVWDKVCQQPQIRSSGFESCLPATASGSNRKDLSGNHNNALESIKSIVSSRTVPTPPLALDNNNKKSVPKLNMSYVEPPSPIQYSDRNVNGPPGQPIAMVRTGGFSSIHV